MTHDRARVREDLGLRHVALEADVRRRRPERCRVELAAHRRDDLHRQLTEPREHALEEVARLEVELGAEREVHRRRIRCEDRGRRNTGPERVQRRGIRERGIAKAGRDGRQDEVASEHLELRIGRQALLGAHEVERLREIGVAHQRAGRKDDHTRVRNAELLRDDQAAEVDLVADENVWSPVLAQLTNRGCVLAGELQAETDLEVACLLVEVNRKQRRPFRRTIPVRSGREDGESELLRGRQDRSPSRHGDCVPGVPGGNRNREQRLQVPRPAHEREERAHGRRL